MKQSKYLNDLIDALTTLPGVGKKSAQRMAYKLMRSNKEKTLNFLNSRNAVTSGLTEQLLFAVDQGYLSIPQLNFIINLLYETTFLSILLLVINHDSSLAKLDRRPCCVHGRYMLA